MMVVVLKGLAAVSPWKSLKIIDEFVGTVLNLLYFTSLSHLKCSHSNLVRLLYFTNEARAVCR